MQCALSSSLSYEYFGNMLEDSDYEKCELRTIREDADYEFLEPRQLEDPCQRDVHNSLYFFFH